MNGRIGQKGYTVNELLTVLMLAGLSMAAVAPSVSEQRKSAAVNKIAQEMACHFSVARLRGISHQVTSTITVHPDESTYVITPGPRMVVLPEDFILSLMAGSPSEFSFDGSGLLTDPAPVGFIISCRGYSYSVTVSAGGRVKVEKVAS